MSLLRFIAKNFRPHRISEPKLSTVRGFLYPLRQCSTQPTFQSLRNDCEPLLHRIRVHKLTSTEISKRDSVTLFLSLVCAERWREIAEIFTHYQCAMRLTEEEFRSPDAFVIPDGSNVTAEMQRREDMRYFASAVSVNTIATAVLRLLQMRIEPGEVSPKVGSEKTAIRSSVDVMCTFYGMFPPNLMFHPLLLSIVLLPSWGTARVRTPTDVNTAISDLCAGQTEFIDETLQRTPVGGALIHYLHFRQAFPASTLSFVAFCGEFQSTCADSLAVRDGTKSVKILAGLASSALKPKAFLTTIRDEMLAPELRYLMLLALPHFISNSPVSEWTNVQSLVEDLREQFCHTDLHEFWQSCFLCITRLAVLNGKLDDAIGLCNTHFAAHDWAPNDHLMCTLAMAATRVRLMMHGSQLHVKVEAVSETSKRRYAIVEHAKPADEAFRVSTCVTHINQSGARFPARFIRSLFQRMASSPHGKAIRATMENICLDTLRRAEQSVSNDDVRAVCDILTKNQSKESFKHVVQSLLYCAPVEGETSASETTNCFEEWTVFAGQRPMRGLTVSPSLGTVTLLMHHSVRLGCTDISIDIFYHFVLPLLRGDKHAELSCQMPTDPKFFALCLVTCLKHLATHPMEIIFEYISTRVFPMLERPLTIKNIGNSEKLFLDERYAASRSALTNSLSYTVHNSRETSREETPFDFMQGVFAAVRAFSNDSEVGKARRVIDELSLPQGMSQLTLSGMPISLNKVFDLSVGTFPRSLLA